MLKAIKLLLSCAAASVILFVFDTPSAHAYCVYNKIGGSVRITAVTNGGDRQPGGRAFDATMSNGGENCCNWQNQDCNPGKQQNAWVAMYAGMCNITGMPISKDTAPLKGGGWGLYGEGYGDTTCGRNSPALAICGLSGTEIDNIDLAGQAKIPWITQNKDRIIVLLQAGGWLELGVSKGLVVMNSYRTNGQLLYSFPCRLTTSN